MSTMPVKVFAVRGLGSVDVESSASKVGSKMDGWGTSAIVDVIAVALSRCCGKYETCSDLLHCTNC